MGSRGERSLPSSWVKGSRNAPLPRWRRLGSKGAGTPSGRWVWESEVSHLVIIRLNAGERQRPGGCNGGAQRAPLPRYAWYYHAHLAFCATAENTGDVDGYGLGSSGLRSDLTPEKYARGMHPNIRCAPLRCKAKRRRSQPERESCGQTQFGYDIGYALAPLCDATG
jgi:hypothetical protein